MFNFLLPHRNGPLCNNSFTNTRPKPKIKKPTKNKDINNLPRANKEINSNNKANTLSNKKAKARGPNKKAKAGTIVERKRKHKIFDRGKSEKSHDPKRSNSPAKTETKTKAIDKIDREISSNNKKEYNKDLIK